MRPIFLKKNMCVSDRPTDHNIFYAKKKEEQEEEEEEEEEEKIKIKIKNTEIRLFLTSAIDA